MVLLGFSLSAIAHEHGGKGKDHKHGTAKTTGQGDWVFEFDKVLTAKFPEAAKKFEPKMHGGFNTDPETNTVYTGIPGYGLCSISSDLTEWKLLGDDPKLKDNVHGIVFFVHKGKKYLALAQNNKRVLVVDINGKIVSEVTKPKGTEFDYKAANDFFASKKSNFGVTDVTYLDGTIYVAHGYSRGDFIMTITEADGKWSWGKLAWGSKGREPGQFITAHGIFAHDGSIYVANREAHKVVKFTKEGKFVEELKDIPKGSRVCNVAFVDGHFIFCPLAPVNKSKTAPIYAHTGEKLVSTIIPGDLDIPVLKHVHHAWPHVVDKDGKKQVYILIHGWNKGKFAVLIRVKK